jgi:hypothetical protein
MSHGGEILYLCVTCKTGYILPYYPLSCQHPCIKLNFRDHQVNRDQQNRLYFSTLASAMLGILVFNHFVINEIHLGHLVIALRSDI